METKKELAEKALKCIYIEVDESIADDLNKKVNDYISELKHKADKFDHIEQMCLNSLEGAADACELGIKIAEYLRFV